MLKKLYLSVAVVVGVAAEANGLFMLALVLLGACWLASFRITDDGAVALVFLPRPIVDPHHACPSLGKRYGVFGRDGGGPSLLTRIIGSGQNSPLGAGRGRSEMMDPV